MNEAQNEQQIREVVATWMRATTAGDLAQVLSLMAEDVVFLLEFPFRGAARRRAIRSRIRDSIQPQTPCLASEATRAQAPTIAKNSSSARIFVPSLRAFSACDDFDLRSAMTR